MTKTFQEKQMERIADTLGMVQTSLSNQYRNESLVSDISTEYQEAFSKMLKTENPEFKKRKFLARVADTAMMGDDR